LQVHTTGTDIPQSLNAVAAVTLSKDMNWRDMAQGCYRMRLIGQGQRVHIYVTPEVRRLIDQADAACHAKPSSPGKFLVTH